MSKPGCAMQITRVVFWGALGAMTVWALLSSRLDALVFMLGGAVLTLVSLLAFVYLMIATVEGRWDIFTEDDE